MSWIGDEFEFHRGYKKLLTIYKKNQLVMGWLTNWDLEDDEYADVPDELEDADIWAINYWREYGRGD